MEPTPASSDRDPGMEARRSVPACARRALAAALASAQLACAGPPRAIDSPASYLTEHRPRRIEIVRRDGAQLTVEKPRVFADSLLGWDPRAGEEVWLALADLREVRVRQVDPARTALFVVAASGAVIALVSALSGSGSSSRADEIMEAAVQPRAARIP